MMKVLAALPGQDVELGDRLLRELQDFIDAIFANAMSSLISIAS